MRLLAALLGLSVIGLLWKVRRDAAAWQRGTSDQWHWQDAFADPATRRALDRGIAEAKAGLLVPVNGSHAYREEDWLPSTYRREGLL